MCKKILLLCRTPHITKSHHELSALRCQVSTYLTPLYGIPARRARIFASRVTRTQCSKHMYMYDGHTYCLANITLGGHDMCQSPSPGTNLAYRRRGKGLIHQRHRFLCRRLLLTFSRTVRGHAIPSGGDLSSPMGTRPNRAAKRRSCGLWKGA